MTVLTYDFRMRPRSDLQLQVDFLPRQVGSGETSGIFTGATLAIFGGFHRHGGYPEMIGLFHGKSHEVWMMTGGTPMTKRKPPSIFMGNLIRKQGHPWESHFVVQITGLVGRFTEPPGTPLHLG